MGVGSGREIGARGLWDLAGVEGACAGIGKGDQSREGLRGRAEGEGRGCQVRALGSGPGNYGVAWVEGASGSCAGPKRGRLELGMVARSHGVETSGSLRR